LIQRERHVEIIDKSTLPCISKRKIEGRFSKATASTINDPLSPTLC
jgi:hypothetical protein